LHIVICDFQCRAGVQVAEDRNERDAPAVGRLGLGARLVDIGLSGRAHPQLADEAAAMQNLLPQAEDLHGRAHPAASSALAII
ncbi:MAG: hypothetical protein ACTHLR_08665, partial [Rhizomicrobium sp.]